MKILKKNKGFTVKIDKTNIQSMYVRTNFQSNYFSQVKTLFSNISKFSTETTQPILNFKKYLLVYTANVLSGEIADVCLKSKSKDSHWLFIHVSVCD